MLLSAGQKLAHYEILELVGQGGMGEVYRARDTKLGRDVAINVLPEAFAQDQERLSRFKREAKLLVSLNHSNIATLHGLEQSGPHHYLVMEFVEGETLADRIAKGPVPIDEALALFGQIAEGLEAAHDNGVIHRDLKPDNIKITPDGKPKILDFGLAKARDQQPGSNRSESPTVTKGTLAGVILGTASYMSPEQASGRSVDTRTDIWSFGVVLWEALLGRPLFTGETVSHVLAAVLRDEIDWSALPGGTPRAVRRLLRRCLEREPEGRPSTSVTRGSRFTKHRTSPRQTPMKRILAARAAAWRQALPWSIATLLVGSVITALAVWPSGGLGPAPSSPADALHDFAPRRAANETVT